MNNNSENTQTKNLVLLKEFGRLRKNHLYRISVNNSEWYSLFKDEIRNSIAIEGIFSNRNDLINVLEKNQKTSNQKTSAILGYFDAAYSLYEYANNLFKQNEFEIRLADIRQIHTLLMRYEKQVGSYIGGVGEFRVEDVAVTESHFSPLKYIYINEFMVLYVRWLNFCLKTKRYEPIKLAALSHILFETIHPFRDGNGRAGRIFLSYMLIGLGYCNIPIKGVLKGDRDTYYQALEQGDDMFEALLRQIENGEKITKENITRAADNSNIRPLESIIAERLDYALKTLNRDIFRESGSQLEIPLREAAKFFNYSRDYLRNLINSKKLPAKKKGKLWYVKLSDIEEYTAKISGDREER
ncbi:MAG: Fic family protein [Ignavibacteriaceae bacterium]